MSQHLQLRRGTAAEWSASNPVLRAGEPGYALDTGELRIGDGTTAWNSLDAFGVEPEVNTQDYIVSYTRLQNPNFTGGIYRYNGGGGLIETNGYGVADEYYIPKWDAPAGFNAHLDAMGALSTTTTEATAYWGDDLPAGTVFFLDPGIYRWTFLSQLKVATTPDADDSLYCYIDTGLVTDDSFANNDTQPVFLAAGVNPRLVQLGGNLFVETANQPLVPAITTTPTTVLAEAQYLAIVFWKVQ